MKRYVKSSDDLTSERKDTFLKNVDIVNREGTFDDEIEYMLEEIGSTYDYFSFDKYSNFDEATRDWGAEGKEKEEEVNEIDSMLSKYGASTNNETYKVDWGTEPLYLTLSDTGVLVVVDTSDSAPQVMSFRKWLDSWFEDDPIQGVQIRSDVEIAMKHMGVSYK